MRTLDWLVFGAFLFYVIYDGIRRSRGTKDLEGYFAGGRSIPWWAAGLSVMATQASAITVIGTTGQGHEGGMAFIQLYLGLPFAMILLSIFVIPMYRRAPILTAYQYLEQHFGLSTRIIASLIFLVSRGLALGIVIYAPAVVLSAMTGLNQTVTILIMGVLTTAYTMLGGIRAVIWTDVKQMAVILGGLVICFVMLMWQTLSEFSLFDGLRVLGAAGKLNALEVMPASLDFIPNGVEEKSFWDDKYNLWSGLLGGLFLHLAYFGCDQSQVQRILTNPTANESRKALLLSAFAKVPMQGVVLLIGVFLYLAHLVGEEPMLYRPQDQAVAAQEEHKRAIAEFQQQFDHAHSERLRLAHELVALPDGVRSDQLKLAAYREQVHAIAEIRSAARAEVQEPEKRKKDTNYIFPHWILGNLPPIILGLVIAAIFAAAMSSIDSALNSLTSSTIVDHYRRWIRPKVSEPIALRASRVVTIFWGSIATMFALVLRDEGSIIELINKVGSFFYGSLLGVFVLTLIVPRRGGLVGSIGLLGGMGTVCLAHWGPWTFQYLWYNVIGCAGVMVFGLGTALGVSVFGARSHGKV